MKTTGKQFFALCLLLIVCSFSNCKSTKAGQGSSTTKGVKFTNYATLSDALDEAEAQSKLVFVDFYTTWCLPCKMMDKDVFSDKSIGTFMNEHFINYKVDAEKGNGRNLAVVYNVRAYPTLFFLDAKGNVLESKEGAAYHTELKRMARRAMERNQQ